LLWELLSCQQLWCDLSEAQVRTLMQRGLRPQLSDFFAPHVRALLQECWSEMPAERPVPVEILFRLSGARHSPYLFLPKSMMLDESKSILRPSLRNANSSEPATSKSKRVKWALLQEHPSETNVEQSQTPLQKILDFAPAAALPPPLAPHLLQRDDQPLNHFRQREDQPLNHFRQREDQPLNHVRQHEESSFISPSSLVQSSPRTADVAVQLQPLMHLELPPLPSDDLVTNESALHETNSAPACSTSAVSATLFSLHLADAPLKSDAILLQREQHESRIERAMEHVHAALPHVTAPPLVPKHDTPEASSTSVDSPRLLLRQSASSMSPSSSSPRVQPCHSEFSRFPASASQLSAHHAHDMHHSPSKLSSHYYDAASTIAAHVLAAKHLESSGSVCSRGDAAAATVKFEQYEQLLLTTCVCQCVLVSASVFSCLPVCSCDSRAGTRAH
jgi:hypothetical protein